MHIPEEQPHTDQTRAGETQPDIYAGMSAEQIADHQRQQDAYLSDPRNNRSHRYNGTDLRPVFTDGPGNERGR